jgi:hypothetical protein
MAAEHDQRVSRITLGDQVRRRSGMHRRSSDMLTLARSIVMRIAAARTSDEASPAGACYNVSTLRPSGPSTTEIPALERPSIGRTAAAAVIAACSWACCSAVCVVVMLASKVRRRTITEAHR